MWQPNQAQARTSQTEPPNRLKQHVNKQQKKRKAEGKKQKAKKK